MKKQDPLSINATFPLTAREFSMAEHPKVGLLDISNAGTTFPVIGVVEIVGLNVEVDEAYTPLIDAGVNTVR